MKHYLKFWQQMCQLQATEEHFQVTISHVTAVFKKKQLIIIHSDTYCFPQLKG